MEYPNNWYFVLGAGNFSSLDGTRSLIGPKVNLRRDPKRIP